MTDLLFLDARLAQDNASLMSSTDMKHSMDAESGLAYRNEIKRLREENERLRKGLRELHQLLELPVSSRRAARPKLFPTIGLL